MNPIAVFYHCLFMHGNPPELRPAAFAIVRDQMSQLQDCGLIDAASEIIAGINGPPDESKDYARLLIPAKAKLVLHGEQSFSENLTLVELEKWLPAHPNWNVLYFHAKGCTHIVNSDYAVFSDKWRNCMMLHLVQRWRDCVNDLEGAAEVACCHWMTGLADGTQNICAGNFWWAQSNFLRTLPSIFERDRIKVSGIGAPESRYEAEVWIGNGKRLPVVRDYAGHTAGQCP